MARALRVAASLALVVTAASDAGGATADAAAPLRATSAAPLAQPLWYAVPCGTAYTDDAQYAAAASPGCLPHAAGGCGRYVEDGLFSDDEVAALVAMVRAGMARSDVAAGPTILDLNTGFMRDRVLQNIYKRQRVPPADAGSGAPPVAYDAVNYTAAQFALYGAVYERIHSRLRAVFNLTTLHFTAPTFVTRIRGAPDWLPASLHDEYYHTHSDKANTEHYDYSGLLYLSTAGRDFDGGVFAFSAPRSPPPPPQGADAPYDGDAADAGWRPVHEIAPRAGRLVLFSAGDENMHNVARVTRGERFVFSMWFSCNPARAFTTFLDGRAHVAFDAAPAAHAAMLSADADVVYTDADAR